jgi:Fe-Mn family superoxide dismutase
MKYELPALPYDFDALEPAISADIMRTHWDKHHRAYVNNLNLALEKYEAAEAHNDLEEMIALQQAIKFNGGGHINHSIFWTNLAPVSKGGGQLPKGELSDAIDAKYGSLEKFIQKFNAAAAGVQGSGWTWLGYSREKKSLEIVTCPNQDPLVNQGLIPLLGIDVWEHAYYLQYKNVRPDYLKAIWSVVNWKDVAERYAEAKAVCPGCSCH